MNYRLHTIHTHAILDFIFGEGKEKLDKCSYDIKLMDRETCEIFYDSLTFIYPEMSKN
ncbi:MAG: hypothetical protein AAGC64_00575 [Bacteroidota bacterium]